MIGKCPNCQIELNKPPFKENRITSELMLTLSFRKKIESGDVFKPVEKLGYCELCKSTQEDLEEQQKLILTAPAD
jgi:hypothetical protein